MSEDLGKLVLRIMVAGLMLFHGYAKIVHGIDPIENAFVNAGFPAFIAYGAYIGEVLAPILLILGIQVRLSAFLIGFTMVVAIALTHAGDIFSVTKYGAWAIETQMFYLLGAIAIMFLGEGRYKVAG